MINTEIAMQEKMNSTEEMLELPEPEEKLLRSPTFFEKYPWFKLIVMLVVILSIVGSAIWYVSRLENTPAKFSKEGVDTPQIYKENPQEQSLELYTSSDGLYTIEYSGDYEFINLNGDLNSVSLVSPILESINSNYSIKISYINTGGVKDLKKLIAENPACDAMTQMEGKAGMLNNILSEIYIDIPCGAYGQTVIYTQKNNILYIITVESKAKFEDVKPFADKILATMEFADMGATETNSPAEPTGRTSKTFCTMDAMQCSDGSWVGRTGPNCEFACP